MSITFARDCPECGCMWWLEMYRWPWSACKLCRAFGPNISRTIWLAYMREAK